MIFKSIEEQSISYLEGIGFKEKDHVIVLNLDGSVLHGFLKFNRISSTLFPILLETSDKKTIDLYTIVGICHINIQISQHYLYDIEETYRIIFKELSIDHYMSGFTPRQIFRDITNLCSSQHCNMNIDKESNTIRIFYSEIPLEI